MSEHPGNLGSNLEVKVLFPHLREIPKVDDSVFMADGAIVLGDVHIGANSSIWYHAVLRGDVNFIRIGEGTNIQDNAVVHVSHGGHGVRVGNGVTVGHSAVLHACTVGDYSLIGMRSTVLDGAEIGEFVLLGAGSLVTPGMKIPPRTKVVGSPARVIADLTQKEIDFLKWSGEHYVRLSRDYLRGLPAFH